MSICTSNLGKSCGHIVRSSTNPRARAFRGAQRGEGRAKAIIVLLILVLLVYSAVKLLPPYIAEYQLADKIQEQARFAIVNHTSEEQIRNNVFKVIQDLDIPAAKKDIKIIADDRAVKITVDYIVPVDLLSYHIDLHFTPSSENKSLT